MGAVDTGHGASVSFGTQTFTSLVRAIRGMTWEVAEVDTTGLATTAFSTVLQGDLVNPGEFEIDVLVNNALAEPTVGAAAETITITYPESTAVGAAGTMAGTGFIKSYKFQDFVTDEIQLGTIVVKWDGGTGPAQTDETDA